MELWVLERKPLTVPYKRRSHVAVPMEVAVIDKSEARYRTCDHAQPQVGFGGFAPI